jgi:hypothetical protein
MKSLFDEWMALDSGRTYRCDSGMDGGQFVLLRFAAFPA